MTGNHTSPSLITGILDVLDRHGYACGDDEHTARAIVLISDLAHIYEGSLDHPFGPYIGEIPSRTEPAPPGPAGPDAVLHPGRPGQEPPGRPGHSRRPQARSRRALRRLHRSILP